MSDDGAEYTIPANVVHRIVFAIASAMLSIVLYTILWAIEDARFKARLMTRIEMQDQQLLEVRSGMKQIIAENASMARIDERIKALERRMEDLHR